ncbi:MAG: hypothetical protein WC867_05010 [Candidatus Pacearchaeota archaeon]|jgi:hypothetical protein
MKKGVWRLLCLIFSILIFKIGFINGENFSTEILSKEQLLKDIINESDIKDIGKMHLNDILSSSKEELKNNPSDVFQKWTINLYNNFRLVGEPKLIFNEEKAIAYVVPLLTSDNDIGGFFILNPYDGSIINYPDWNIDGNPTINYNYNDWINLEENIANSVNTSITEETRLIVIKDSPLSQVMYIATPEIKPKTLMMRMSLANVSNENNSNEDNDQITRVRINGIDNKIGNMLNQTPSIYSNNSTNNEAISINNKMAMASFSSIPISPPVPGTPGTFFISKYDQLPWKNQIGKSSWSSYVNNNLNPIWKWRVNNADNKDALKCLSYGASTVADWFNLQLGGNFGNYKSFVRGEIESGQNPRELEQVYHSKFNPSDDGAFFPDTKCGCNNYCYVPGYLQTPLWVAGYDITNEYIPWCIEGYAKTLTSVPTWSYRVDDDLKVFTSDFQYTTWYNKYKINNYYQISDYSSSSAMMNIQKRIRENGVLYIQMEDSVIGGFAVHTVAVVGYGKLDNQDILIIHDSHGFSNYKAATLNNLADKPIYFKTDSTISLSSQTEGSNYHYCSNYYRTASINSISFSDPNPKPSDKINTILSWTGYHSQGSPNYWAFFLDDYSTPVGTCISRGYNNGYDSPSGNNYNMNCQITIPTGTRPGSHSLKITANNNGGYCVPNEGALIKTIQIEVKPLPLCIQNWSCAPWTICNIGTQTRICSDLNNCNNITGKPKEFQNCDFYEIIYPVKNSILSSKKVSFFINTSKIQNNIDYQVLNIKNPYWKNLCKNCNKYIGQINFKEGNNTILVRFNSSQGSITKTINFFIDSITPKITNTYPKRGSYINKTAFFSFDFKEENPYSEYLYINDKIVASGNSRGLSSIPAYLDSFDNKEIYYSFNLTDIAGNSYKSKPILLKVDNTPPKINQISAYGRLISNTVDIKINISELNFDKVEYKDSNDISPKWKILCRSLNKGICKSKIYYKGNVLFISIKITDKAGNSIEQPLAVSA